MSEMYYKGFAILGSPTWEPGSIATNITTRSGIKPKIHQTIASAKKEIDDYIRSLDEIEKQMEERKKMNAHSFKNGGVLSPKDALNALIQRRKTIWLVSEEESERQGWEVVTEVFFPGDGRSVSHLGEYARKGIPKGQFLKIANKAFKNAVSVDYSGFKITQKGYEPFHVFKAWFNESAGVAQMKRVSPSSGFISMEQAKRWIDSTGSKAMNKSYQNGVQKANEYINSRMQNAFDHSPFGEGARARQQGTKKVDCPYSLTDPKGVQWVKGWNEADKFPGRFGANGDRVSNSRMQNGLVFDANCYEEGQKARKAGKPMESNPYVGDEGEAKSWLKGWENPYTNYRRLGLM